MHGDSITLCSIISSVSEVEKLNNIIGQKFDNALELILDQNNEVEEDMSRNQDNPAVNSDQDDEMSDGVEMGVFPTASN